MKNNSRKGYYEFFLELPQTDYLNDIEIHDEYEKTADYPMRGLSDEQVSQIAHDSLTDARRNRRMNQQFPNIQSASNSS